MNHDVSDQSRLTLRCLTASYTSAKRKRNGMAKLFVGNIPHAASDAELMQWVVSHGFQVDSAQIIRDRSTGQSRGFGFVMLSDGPTAKEAISALNGQRMGSRVLTVNEALPQAPRDEYRGASG
jgi:RNA recognition motif-containing protein